MRFIVNEEAVQYRMDPDTPLLWALRDASNLTGTKYGCDTGECGFCIVNVDGKAVKSCQVRIGQLEGRFVTTIEGLSRDRSHPIQQAWVAASVPQCGFCQSGMIMAAAALLDANPAPTDAQIDGAMDVICRCGTYPRIREAVRRAARAKAGGEPIAAAPPPDIRPQDAARVVPSLRPEPSSRRRPGPQADREAESSTR
ncbi:MAG TPA: (2Fe-2S)-binding protein [Allosphingosinicella sp.]|jgi:isoquinoline 1-oxidoreductase alpha subunit